MQEHDKDDGQFTVKGEGGSNKSDLTRPDANSKINSMEATSLKGTVTSKGTEINIITDHAAKQMTARNITLDEARDVLTNPHATYSGNKNHPDYDCYHKNKIRLLVNPKTGDLVTAIRLNTRRD